jgi:DNA transposition AAA+ family ATPase
MALENDADKQILAAMIKQLEDAKRDFAVAQARVSTLEAAIAAFMGNSYGQMRPSEAIRKYLEIRKSATVAEIAKALRQGGCLLANKDPEADVRRTARAVANRKYFHYDEQKGIISLK